MSSLGVPPKCSLNIDKYLGLQLAIGLPISFGVLQDYFRHPHVRSMQVCRTLALCMRECSPNASISFRDAFEH